MKPPDSACHTRSHLGVRSPPPTMVLSRTEHTPLLDGGTRLIPRARARVARSRGDISFRLSVIVVAGNGLDPPGFARRARLMTRVAPVSSRLPFPCPSSRAPPRRSARPESDLSERPVDPLAAADEQTTSGSRITARTALRCVAGAAIAGLALFAVAGSGIKVRDTTRDPLAAFHRCVQFPHASETHTSLTLPPLLRQPSLSLSALGASSEVDTMADATAARRTAAAAAALTKETALNAKAAKEAADAAYASAEADAEKLDKLAAQARRDYDFAVATNVDAGDGATVGVQEILDDALKEDTTLTAMTATYTAARQAYQDSSDALVGLAASLEEARAASASAQRRYDEASASADALKTAADAAQVDAERANAENQANARVGEETAEEAIARAKVVADASAAAQAAEIQAARAKELAANKLDALNSATLAQKTAQETLDAETARNEVLAAESNEAEQRMIEQSHITALAKTAAADARATSLDSYFNASTAVAAMKDAADKAEQEADHAKVVAKTRLEEAKAAERAARAASDADDIARAELTLAERTVDVEEKKEKAVKDAQQDVIEAEMTDGSVEDVADEAVVPGPGERRRA